MKIISLPFPSGNGCPLKMTSHRHYNGHEQLWPIREAQLSCNVSYESSRLMHTHTHTHTHTQRERESNVMALGKTNGTAHLTQRSDLNNTHSKP